MGVRRTSLGAQLGDVRVVVCVPFRSMGCEYRERNWKYVRSWWARHHPEYPLYIGTSDRDPFSPAQARNNAAREAGDWDVAIFADADTLTHPDSVREAVTLAADIDKMVIISNGHIYTDELSTQRFLDTGLMFPTPTDWPDTRRQRFTFDERSVYRDPCSGVLAVSKTLWGKTGGYVDSLGGQDAFEDLVFYAQCQIFGAGVTRVEGMALHLHHPTAARVKGVNNALYRQLVAVMGKPDAQRKARTLLAQFGHLVP